MHELALVQNIIEMVSEHARGQSVRRVKIEIGKLTCVSPDAIRFCFDVVTTNTPLEGARLEIAEIEAQAKCRVCGTNFAQQMHWDPCRCGAQDFERITGEELRVKEYELGACATA